MFQHVARAHRRREDNARCSPRTNNLARDASGGAGRDTVIDHHHGAPRDVNARPSLAHESDSLVEDAPLSFLDATDLILTHARVSHYLLIKDTKPAFANRPHRHLWLIGNAQLANDHDVERCVENLRHFGSHWHPAPWQSHHHDIVVP